MAYLVLIFFQCTGRCTKTMWAFIVWPIIQYVRMDIVNDSVSYKKNEKCLTRTHFWSGFLYPEFSLVWHIKFIKMVYLSSGTISECINFVKSSFYAYCFRFNNWHLRYAMDGTIDPVRVWLCFYKHNQWTLKHCNPYSVVSFKIFVISNEKYSTLSYDKLFKSGFYLYAYHHPQHIAPIGQCIMWWHYTYKVYGVRGGWS